MPKPDISEVLAGALLENDQLRAHVAELEANAKQREDLIQDNRERLQVLKTRVAELEAAGREALVELRRVSPSFAAPKLRALLEP